MTSNSNYHWEARIRQEASSQSIEKTIQGVENALGEKFPRVGTPSQNREVMLTILATGIFLKP